MASKHKGKNEADERLHGLKVTAYQRTTEGKERKERTAGVVRTRRLAQL